MTKVKTTSLQQVRGNQILRHPVDSLVHQPFRQEVTLLHQPPDQPLHQLIPRAHVQEFNRPTRPPVDRAKRKPWPFHHSRPLLSPTPKRALPIQVTRHRHLSMRAKMRSLYLPLQFVKFSNKKFRTIPLKLHNEVGKLIRNATTRKLHNW